MEITFSEAQLLFEHEPLIPIPGTKAIVGLSVQETPNEEQLVLLSKILKALGLKQGSFRFLHYDTPPVVTDFVEEDVLILVFQPDSAGVFNTVVEKSGKRDLIIVPSLGQIGSNSDIKREVWNTLKPYSGR
jgi:hypothetical protein